MRTRRHTHLMRTIPVALAFLLSGCGTNVMYLLKEESRVMAEADPLLVEAETAGNGMERQVYEAEAAKDDACAFLHSAVFDRFNRDPNFFEQFVSDLSASVVLIFPVGQVEDCADAFAAYTAAVDNLANSINSSAELSPSDETEIENGVN